MKEFLPLVLRSYLFTHLYSTPRHLCYLADICASYVQIAAKFLKPDKKTADLIGNEKMKASASVRHIVLPCSTSARAQLIPDIIRCYSRLFDFFAQRVLC